MKSIKVLLFTLAVLFTISCSKDKDDVSVTDRASALLGQWEYESIMTDHAVDINGDGTANIDLFNTQEIQQCLKDNLTFFTERGEGEKGAYSVNENGLACEEGEQYSNIEDDRYELINNSIIKFDNRNEMRIVEFTKNRLVIDTEDKLNDTDVIVTITFKRS